MQEQLFIPEKIKVGYQERDDTYTKRLGYVIYYDSKGKLRKETSWKSWCQLEDTYQDDYVRDYKGVAQKDSSGKYKMKKTLYHKGLGFNDYPNIPTEGFVLNKDVGGVRNSWSSWNQRTEKVRVFDPRGFEFEINIPNLLFILQECSSVKGKGLEGEFVYSWEGPELILLPVGCLEYKKSKGFTAIQKNKVSFKELKEGFNYLDKNQKELVYLGKFNVYGNLNYYSKGYTTVNPSKQHVFLDEKTKKYESKASLDFLSNQLGDEINPGYSGFLENLNKNPLMGKVKGIEEIGGNIVYKASNYSNDYSLTSGKDYISTRKRKLIENFGGTLLIPENDFYYVVNPFRKIKEVKGSPDYYFTWELEGFGLNCSKIIKIEGNELVEKSIKNLYLDKLYTKKEFEKLPFLKLKVELKNSDKQIIYGS